MALASLVLLAASASAQGGARLGGDLSTRLVLRARDCGGSPGGCELLDFTEILDLGLAVDQSLGSAGRVRARLEARQLHLTGIETLEDTQEASAVQPVGLRIAQARLDLYDLLPRVDVSLGVLRIPWGTADGINPNDRLNPFDLRDPSRFDRRLASPALLVAAHPVRRLTLELVALPFFVPAALPVEGLDVSSAEDPSLPVSLDDYVAEGADVPDVRSLSTRIELPERTLGEQSSLAARLSLDSPWGTFALSGYWGRDSLPQASGEVWLTGMQTSHRIDVAVGTRYPRIATVGLDWRGELPWRLSGWVEAALVRPSRTVVTLSHEQMAALVRLGRIASAPEPGAYATTQEDTPYLQAVAGLHRGFGSRLQVVLQLVRGMPLERTASDQHVYGVAALRWDLVEELVHLEAQGMAALDDPEGAAGLGRLGIGYLHADRVRIRAGLCWVDGEEGTFLARYSQLSHLDVGAAVDF